MWWAFGILVYNIIGLLSFAAIMDIIAKRVRNDYSRTKKGKITLMSIVCGPLALLVWLGYWLYLIVDENKIKLTNIFIKWGN